MTYIVIALIITAGMLSAFYLGYRLAARPRTLNLPLLSNPCDENEDTRPTVRWHTDEEEYNLEQKRKLYGADAEEFEWMLED